MSRFPIRAFAIPAAWLIAGAALLPLGRPSVARSLSHLPATLATILATIAGAVAIGVALGHVRLPVSWHRARHSAMALPLALAVAGWSGGIASPAVIVVALALLGWTWGRRAAWVIPGALAVAALLVAVHLWAGLPLEPAAALVPVALLVAASVIPVLLAARTERLVGEARERTERLEQFLAVPRVTPGNSTAAAPAAQALRHDSLRQRAQEEEERRFTAVARWLADVRDQHAADDAVYWRFTPRRDGLEAAAWANGRSDVPPALEPSWVPVVQWAASEGMVQCDAGEAGVTLGAAPVLIGGQVAGVLTASAPGGMATPRAELRDWLGRHATQLACLVELLDTSREHQREHVQTTALLSAAQRFQSHRRTEDLGVAICETALQVTSGTRATLVRWFAAEHRGVVESAVGPQAVCAGQALDAASLVAEACRKGMPEVWEDARRRLADSVVFGAGEPARQIGSLGIWLLKREELDVIGAIVVEGAEPHAVLIRDIRNVKLLGGFAVLALETVWEIADVTRRATTDQLTGLHNRRYFDEQFEKVRQAHLRWGHPCSLIVADVDHFKKVNDTHGHDGGDAVLKAVAAVFRDGVRTVDICARFGGEEVAILLPETPLAGAVELAERLRQAIQARAIRFKGREIPVTASFGVACVPESVTGWDGFFAAADRALYQAKAEGRNRVKSAEPSTARKAT